MALQTPRVSTSSDCSAGEPEVKSKAQAMVSGFGSRPGSKSKSSRRKPVKKEYTAKDLSPKSPVTPLSVSSAASGAARAGETGLSPAHNDTPASGNSPLSRVSASSSSFFAANTVGVLDAEKSKIAMLVYELKRASSSSAGRDESQSAVTNIQAGQDASEESESPSKRSEQLEQYSNFSDPTVVASVCIENVPGWKDTNQDLVEVAQLCEGLSNQVFRVVNKDKQRVMPASMRCVLFRVYGSGIVEFYDPKRELAGFKMLAQYQIAPSLIAIGDSWRIEEWHNAFVLPTRSLQNPSVFCQVASHLARLHKLHKRSDFPMKDFDTTPGVFVYLEHWKAAAVKAASQCPEAVKRFQTNGIDFHSEYISEAVWFEQYVREFHRKALENTTQVPGLCMGFDVVFCHNDCQENNLLQTQYGLRMIDFEYSHFNFQSYDIGNFFDEFTMDYTHSQWPFFTRAPEDYPTQDRIRMFASVYLSEYLGRTILDSHEQKDQETGFSGAKLIDLFVEAIPMFSAAAHLLWSYWSVVRANQAQTYPGFDFAEYAVYRFQQYKVWKESAEYDSVSSSGDEAESPSLKDKSANPRLPRSSVSRPPSPKCTQIRRSRTMDIVGKVMRLSVTLLAGSFSILQLNGNDPVSLIRKAFTT